MRVTDVVVVEAVRTPVGRRGGALRDMHPAVLLGSVMQELLARVALDPASVEQVVGGCVSQVGEQSFNITRTAWLAAGLPASVGAATVDTQCGSSQHATNLAIAQVASGMVDVAIACGVEVMSRVPIGANSEKSLGLGVPIPKSYYAHYERTSQFEGAERIADRWGITRRDCDEFGLLSQQRAAQAWDDGRFTSQVMPVDVPAGPDGEQPPPFVRDEGLRATTLEGLAGLKPVGRPEGVLTAGSSSQISDGAAAVLLMTADKAAELGLRPRAVIVDTCLVGVDPEMMLTGPIDATQRLLSRTGLVMSDIDVVEINEAFAPVVLAWQRELKADLARTNPNGGAIATGHPLGATGAILMTKALNELERSDGVHALVTMCCGGGLGTGTILRRL